jgi:hypothetical protein
MIRVALVAVLLASGNVGASAAEPQIQFTGTDLAEACSDGFAYYNYGRCAGYIMGIHDAAILGEGTEAGICAPANEGISDALIEPVAEYLALPSTDLTLPAMDLVLGALRQAFPCE